ncbi:MAG: [acyl-carrier-protein] S-malonyltransferase [Rhodospirillales bacterium]|nr:[acyl-carrier-protein] S-malonyltransferase [Rhodospirillales bacterium]
MSRAFVFPGQGSQEVGMGRELLEAFTSARLVFEEIDDALGQKLSSIIFKGPAEELILTENAQPALMAVSTAVIRVLEEQGNFRIAQKASYVAGHSLGEYSALTSVKALELADAARLLKIRGKAMQAAVPLGKGAMAAILGLGLEEVEEVVLEASQSEICEVANDNSDGQVVVSGNVSAVERSVEIAKKKGAKRGILLPVSAPFHCQLMQPAADVMRDALMSSRLITPELPVITNVNAQPVRDPEELRNLLIEQITKKVRWRESILSLSNLGVEHIFEVGSGKVLSGLTRRINSDLKAQSIATPAEVETFLQSL